LKPNTGFMLGEEFRKNNMKLLPAQDVFEVKDIAKNQIDQLISTIIKDY